MAHMVMDRIILNEDVILTSQIHEDGFIICISSLEGKDLGTIAMNIIETQTLFQLNTDPLQ